MRMMVVKRTKTHRCNQKNEYKDRLKKVKDFMQKDALLKDVTLWGIFLTINNGLAFDVTDRYLLRDGHFC